MILTSKKQHMLLNSDDVQIDLSNLIPYLEIWHIRVFRHQENKIDELKFVLGTLGGLQIHFQIFLAPSLFIQNERLI